MNARKSSMVAVIAAALLAPAVSMANSEWHQENTNRGFSYHPEHAKSTLNRAQVQNDAGAAAANRLIREGAPLDTFPAATAGKSRDQVRSEALNLSPVQKQLLQALYGGN